MAFLLFKIFVLLCLAALMGAAFAWWWMRRRFVDVTDTHTELNRQVDAFLAGRDLPALPSGGAAEDGALASR